MSDDFSWELEKLRRKFGVGDEELKEEVRKATLKPRGAKPQRNDADLARIRAGASVRTIAVEKNLSNSTKILLGRKNKRAVRVDEYWQCLDQLIDLSGDEFSKSKAIVDRLKELLRDVPRGAVVLLDFAACLQQRGLRANHLLPSDRDNLEAAAFHHKQIEAPDDPGRRDFLARQIRVLKKVIQEAQENKIYV
jgi:hypothetical protein